MKRFLTTSWRRFVFTKGLIPLTCSLFLQYLKVLRHQMCLRRYLRLSFRPKSQKELPQNRLYKYIEKKHDQKNNKRIWYLKWFKLEIYHWTDRTGFWSKQTNRTEEGNKNPNAGRTCVLRSFDRQLKKKTKVFCLETDMEQKLWYRKKGRHWVVNEGAGLEGRGCSDWSGRTVWRLQVLVQVPHREPLGRSYSGYYGNPNPNPLATSTFFCFFSHQIFKQKMFFFFVENSFSNIETWSKSQTI